MTFSENDQHHLEAASGYITLGLHLDANDELEKITPELRAFPRVLSYRLEIYRALQKWELMQVVAKTLAVNEPKKPQWWASWAYATRRADSINAARFILLNALDQHPASAVLHYNLACYECQLGDLDEAKAKLKLAFELDEKLRRNALEDQDLEPLWASL